ncbi:MAG: hypothetical protein K0R43_1577 [Pseudoduganella sp.]|jgi:spermidine synthase|nr:hypothetical protein [Pseudoduganella sp.]
MKYRPARASRPPPVFELQYKASMAQLAAHCPEPFPPVGLMARLRDYLQSMLLAENLPPTVYMISMLLEKFSLLAQMTQRGKPFIYKKRRTISLLFDMSAVQSEMSLDAPDELVLGYTQTMMGFLLFKPDPRRIGMIGLGGGSLAKFCHRYLPDATMDVAEIDAGVIELRDQFHIPADDARLAIHCMDGADYVRQSSGTFDVILLDGFDRHGQPPQLCTQAFYDDCYRALAPGGILVVNLMADEQATGIYLDRLNTTFNNAVIVLNSLDSLNNVAFAGKGDVLDTDRRTLIRRLEQLESRLPLMLKLTAWSLLLARRTATLAPEHESLDFA